MVVGPWHVEVVPKNEAGKAFILGQYKPFRLEALRLDPGGRLAPNSRKSLEVIVVLTMPQLLVQVMKGSWLLRMRNGSLD